MGEKCAQENCHWRALFTHLVGESKEEMKYGGNPKSHFQKHIRNSAPGDKLNDHITLNGIFINNYLIILINPVEIFFYIILKSDEKKIYFSIS